MIKGGLQMQNKKENFNIVNNEILIYQTEDGHTKIDVKLEDETVWLTQAQLCELYQTSKSNISEHIKHIFEEGELEEAAVVRKFLTTESVINSLSLYIFFICSLIVALETPNNSDNCFWFNQTVFLYTFTSILLLPSCVL